MREECVDMCSRFCSGPSRGSRSRTSVARASGSGGARERRDGAENPRARVSRLRNPLHHVRDARRDVLDAHNSNGGCPRRARVARRSSCVTLNLLVSSSKRTSRGASMWTSRETPPARLRPESEAAAFRCPRFGGRRWLPFVSFQYEYARSLDARALDRSTSPVRRRSLARLPAPGRD